MDVYIDCEWNGFGGELISIGMCSESGDEFYEVMELPCEIDDWVDENVIPILNKAPIKKMELQRLMEHWLSRFPTINIIADWPEDVQWFCRMLIIGPGLRIPTPPLSMEILRVDAPSEMPHNAIADARGIRDHVLAMRSDSLGE